MVDRASQALVEALTLVAPGLALREGLDRILQAQRGALVVLGDDPRVLSICTGGFLLDAAFTSQRLSELAKMDGAIILARDASRIARANVHLVPKSTIPTRETGTRHRTAERVARSLDVPVIAVSESMSTVTVYRRELKHTLPATSWLVDRASQALSTLQRFKSRYDLALLTLSTLEVEDTVSLRDVVAVLQPGEMILGIAEEIEGYLVELGGDGRLIRLQLEEMVVGVSESLKLVVSDYVVKRSQVPRDTGDGKVDAVERAWKAINDLTTDELLDPTKIAAALGLASASESLDLGLEPRGYRLLNRLPRISDVIIDRIVDRFATLSGIMHASLGDLERVDGVGAAKARAIKDGLARTAEAGILARYDER